MTLGPLIKLLPFLPRLKGYRWEMLKADALAGVTVAFILMPQSMAYAQLADLPSYFGLYAALLPPVVGGLFGSSRQLATGPTAVVALMTSASLAPLAQSGSPGFIAYVVMLTLMVGVFQLALGFLRLGTVVNFISHPVVNGFTNAAALIIASSQLSKLFGVQVDKSEYYYETIIRVWYAAWSYTHFPSLAMGLLAIAIMFVLKKLKTASPDVLAAVVITTLLSWGLGFEQNQNPPLSALQSPQLQSTVIRYNQAVEKKIKHLRSSGELRRRAEDAKLDSVKVLELKHLAEKNELLAQLEQTLAAELRARLRSLRLVSTNSPAGRQFYLPGQVPPQMKAEPDAWRFKVGAKPLDLKALPLTAGGEVVGAVRAGLPEFSIPAFDWATLPGMFTYALIIALLGFTESISIAKAMSAKTGQTLDPNQELIGQGLANVSGSFSMSCPVSGSFARSALNLQAGARTPIASVFTSLAVGVSLMYLTPLLYYLPQSVLAAVIMMAVAGLINIHGIVHAWKAQPHDGVIAAVTFVATLGFAPHLDRGIILGVSLSLIVFLYKSMRPYVAELALDEDHAFRDAARHGLKKCDRISVIRFDGPLFFASAHRLETEIAEIRETMPNLRHVLLDCEGIGEMDATGEEALSLTVDRLRAAGMGISFAAVHHHMLKVLKRTGLLAKIGQENMYPSVREAVRHIHADAHKDIETDILCPLLAIYHLGEDGGKEVH